jgi:hypothetical protein
LGAVGCFYAISTVNIINVWQKWAKISIFLLAEDYFLPTIATP